MAMTAMIAVGLTGATAAQKAALSRFLDERDWIAVPNVEGAWAGSFPDADPQAAEAKKAICEHAAAVMREAAAAAGLAHFDAAVQVGVEVPTLFSGP